MRVIEQATGSMAGRGAIVMVALMSLIANPGRASAATCVGDCNGNHVVTVDELVTMVNVALGKQAVSVCPAGDANDNLVISVDEIITAVDRSLDDCNGEPTPTPTVQPCSAQQLPQCLSTCPSDLGCCFDRSPTPGVACFNPATQCASSASATCAPGWYGYTACGNQQMYTDACQHPVIPTPTQTPPLTATTTGTATATGTPTATSPPATSTATGTITALPTPTPTVQPCSAEQLPSCESKCPSDLGCCFNGSPTPQIACFDPAIQCTPSASATCAPGWYGYTACGNQQMYDDACQRPAQPTPTRTPPVGSTPTATGTGTTTPGGTTPAATATATASASGDPTATPTSTPPTTQSCPAGNRAVTFTNYCAQSVWVGATGGGDGIACGVNNACPFGQGCDSNNTKCYWILPTPIDNNGSFELGSSGGSATFCFPPPPSGNTQWNGNVFGRTNCTAAGCQTGDCGGTTGSCPAGQGPTGPTTLSELNLGYNGTADNYDVGIINGMNLSMSLAPNPLPTRTPTMPYACTATGSPQAPSPYTCPWTFSPQTITVPGTMDTFDESLMQNVAGYACSSGAPCPNGLTCSNPNGGYCQCAHASDCVAPSPAGLVCGLAQNTGLGTLAQVCGTALGWWTANEICAADSSYGSPFNCATSIINPVTNNSTKYADLYACAGTNDGDCYNSDTGLTADCCGCPSTNSFTPTNPYNAPWPALIAGQQCYNSNQNWVTVAAPWLTFLKAACPSAYVFPDDDATTSFGCGTQPNYAVTYCPEMVGP